MQPLNPFLRAFFRSTLPSQCTPIQHFILLVPTTEVLLSSRDRETQVNYSDLVSSEDFLASHVLRVPGGVPPTTPNKEASGTFRDNRGKAKQYTTLNGRTLIIKDSFVYTNKGFKLLNQVQLQKDIIFFPDAFDAAPWIIYFITKPLIGSCETVKLPQPSLVPYQANNSRSDNTKLSVNGANVKGKKHIKTFTALLDHFPMIARQMQAGLDRLFKELANEFEKPLPELPATSTTPISLRKRGTSVSSAESFAQSLQSSLHSRRSSMDYPTVDLNEEEEAIRRSLEAAVTAAIDMFQLVDKQQLSLLGSTTDLTGTAVERMVERYVLYQIHDTFLFPKLCALRRNEDATLDAQVRQMSDIDISQVGLSIGHSRAEKQELAVRLTKGVAAFKKMESASSAQEMVEILLETQKLITKSKTEDTDASGPSATAIEPADETNDAVKSEKVDVLLTINADTLVSLLLVVVIRSTVRHLRARLIYMRHFVFIDDTENGEIGYALSTLEAVLSYLANDAGGLKRASKRNRRLWHAVKTGHVAEMRSILEPDAVTEAESASLEDRPMFSDMRRGDAISRPSTSDSHSIGGTTLAEVSDDANIRNAILEWNQASMASPLVHVFPFQRPPTPPPEDRPKIRKRVSMDTRSTSNSSVGSSRSRADTSVSHTSHIDNDTSIETLSRTQGAAGDSVLMMATEAGQVASLKYLLSLKIFYPIGFVLEDEDNEGVTLLSAAIQSGNANVADSILDFILDNAENDDAVRKYLRRTDSQGRCAGHYLFNYPPLIRRIGRFIPWRLKDKNGQTPLFALCRSYDHQEYSWMVDAGLTEAARMQLDRQQLHLDDHMDNKRNSLLHIVSDSQMVTRLLYQCDSDVNAANEKAFTPLMVASKFGRTDVVRVLFGDQRVDIHAKDNRGLTATELAKDDEVRNRIDDLVLLMTPPTPEKRATAVVRSFFVEDGTIRFIIKSGEQNANGTITVTTCRRSLADFESLAKMLSVEHPASWIPDISKFPSPFMIPSKPARSIARDIQLRLDSFLKVLLSHPTFANHEMVWEFFLVPDIDSTMLAERSKRKAETRTEMIKDEYDPITDVREVEVFVGHARDSVRGVYHATKAILRRVNRARQAGADFFDATMLGSASLNSIAYIPQAHKDAFAAYAKTFCHVEFSPMTSFYHNILSISSTITAVLASLNRPTVLINSMSTAQKAIERHNGSLRRSDRWPLGLLDETRKSMQRDALDRIEKSERELEGLGKELRYTQQVVAGELAAWQEERVKMGRAACKDLAKRMVVAEKARLESMLRAVRGLGLGLDAKYGGNRKDGTATTRMPTVFLPKQPLNPDR